MIFGGGFANLVSSVGREFEMVGMLGMSEDDAVKAVVVLKLSEYHEVQPGGIHFGNDCQMVSGSGDA
jgi:hypothetical protein